MEHQAGQLDERPLPPRRYNVERSCLRCHERKVRCNKVMPCSSCLRAKVQCRYPGPERTKRCSQRLSTAKVIPRLERLELAIAAIPKQGSAGAGTNPAVPSRPESVSNRNGTGASRISPLLRTPTEGFLVKDGASTRYVNEVLFSRVLEKESDLQSSIGIPGSSSSSEKRSTTFGFDGLISNPLLSTFDVSSIYPSRWQATQLWQTYLINVDPLLKLLHIPTTQPVVFAAISNPQGVSADTSALLFSIFYAAVTSQRPQETSIILGRDRQSALNLYQRGLEISLHTASFLDSPTITSLQAMSLYLMCRRNHSGGHSGWTLNGLLIRAAQSIGLHRDGEHFNLSPLNCEVRRRLWWQILGYDTRVAEDHGLSTGGFSSFCDTKLPLNVDDKDLYSDMEVVPASKPRWTEMTMFLVAAELNQAVRQVSRLSVGVLNGDDKMNSLEQLLESVKERIEEKYLQYCDPNIPIQKSAILLGRSLLGKLELFVRHQYLRGLNAEESAARATEETLSFACDIMDFGIETKTDELLSNFHWLFSTYTPYHLLTYIIWHLCVRPDVSGADRAWNLVDKSFQLTENPSSPDPGSKWNVIRNLREKALDIRRSFQSAKDSETDTLIPEVTGLGVENSGDDIFNMGFGDGMLWDLDSICFSGGGVPSGF